MQNIFLSIFIYCDNSNLLEFYYLSHFSSSNSESYEEPILQKTDSKSYSYENNANENSDFDSQQDVTDPYAYESKTSYDQTTYESDSQASNFFLDTPKENSFRETNRLNFESSSEEDSQDAIDFTKYDTSSFPELVYLDLTKYKSLKQIRNDPTLTDEQKSAFRKLFHGNKRSQRLSQPRPSQNFAAVPVEDDSLKIDFTVYDVSNYPDLVGLDLSQFTDMNQIRRSTTLTLEQKAAFRKLVHSSKKEARLAGKQESTAMKRAQRVIDTKYGAMEQMLMDRIDKQVSNDGLCSAEISEWFDSKLMWDDKLVEKDL